jgi:hypothetical protein
VLWDKERAYRWMNKNNSNLLKFLCNPPDTIVETRANAWKLQKIVLTMRSQTPTKRCFQNVLFQNACIPEVPMSTTEGWLAWRESTATRVVWSMLLAQARERRLAADCSMSFVCVPLYVHVKMCR